MSDIVNRLDIDRKAERAPVESLGHGKYRVASASSGTEYTVEWRDGLTRSYCECKWGQFHPGAKRDSCCHHAKAAYDFAIVSLDMGIALEEVSANTPPPAEDYDLESEVEF